MIVKKTVIDWQSSFRLTKTAIDWQSSSRLTENSNRLTKLISTDRKQQETGKAHLD